jgi:hypothetical protein
MAERFQEIRLLDPGACTQLPGPSRRKNPVALFGQKPDKLDANVRPF